VPAGVDDQHIYYVDGHTGHDGNSGRSWGDAFATIDKAVDTWNAQINWSATPMRYGCIFIAPGLYAEAPSIPFYCWMIGTGTYGTDSEVEIHPTTGSCMTGTFLGTRIIGIRFEVNEAVDCLNIGICNNSEIAYCTFTNGAAVAATAVSTDNCTHLLFHHNHINSGQGTGMNYGLYFQGGDNKYAHNIRVFSNTFTCTTSAVWIQDTCTASEAFICDNYIRCTGGSSKGIDDNNGTSFCAGNYISANDAIEHPHSTTHCVGNHVSNAGTGAMEVSGS